MGKLGPRAEAKLAVDPAQVRLDGLRADEERGACLSVRCSLGDLEGDLQFLQRQLVDCGRYSANRFSGGAEFIASAFGPWTGADGLERLQGVVKVIARIAPLLRSSESFAIAELGPRTLERHRGAVMELQRSAKGTLKVILQ